MSLNPEAVGVESSEVSLRYDWKTLALYALGIGAKRSELDYLYEARGPKVFPTFAVVPGYPVMFELLGRSGGSLSQVVHASQSVRTLGLLPRSGELLTRGKITGVYDMKKFAQMVFETRTSCEGRPVFEAEWSMFFLGEGGFGGPRPPKSVLPKIPSDAEPVFEFEEQVPQEQALLYRLSGDFNPLHADPAFAAQVGFAEGPILHGLATYGYCARALIHSALGGDAARLRAFHGQFRKPVWPGEVLRTQGFLLDGVYALRSFAAQREDPVALCAGEVSPPL
jgi:acyl dehydratase